MEPPGRFYTRQNTISLDTDEMVGIFLWYATHNNGNFHPKWLIPLEFWGPKLRYSTVSLDQDIPPMWSWLTLTLSYTNTPPPSFCAVNTHYGPPLGLTHSLSPLSPAIKELSQGSPGIGEIREIVTVISRFARSISGLLTPLVTVDTKKRACS